MADIKDFKTRPENEIDNQTFGTKLMKRLVHSTQKMFYRNTFL